MTVEYAQLVAAAEDIQATPVNEDGGRDTNEIAELLGLDPDDLERFAVAAGELEAQRALHQLGVRGLEGLARVLGSVCAYGIMVGVTVGRKESLPTLEDEPK